ncbi:hypothetical protein H4S06_006801, partial [Coemansia sp. BCRC 34490]
RGRIMTRAGTRISLEPTRRCTSDDDDAVDDDDVGGTRFWFCCCSEPDCGDGDRASWKTSCRATMRADRPSEAIDSARARTGDTGGAAADTEGAAGAGGYPSASIQYEWTAALCAQKMCTCAEAAHLMMSGALAAPSCLRDDAMAPRSSASDPDAMESGAVTIEEADEDDDEVRMLALPPLLLLARACAGVADPIARNPPARSTTTTGFGRASSVGCCCCCCCCCIEDGGCFL